MKGVKGALVDWVTPPNGVLRPPLVRNTKNGRGFHHEETGKYLCPTDYDWTDVKYVFLYDVPWITLKELC